MIPVGSVAQTQFVYAHINGHKTQVALRITKPGTREKFAKEKQMFYKIVTEIDQDAELKKVGFPSVLPTLDDIVNAMEVEFDARVAATHQTTAESIYKLEAPMMDGRTFKISVPKVYYSSPDLMISERVYGDNLEQVLNKDKGLGKNIMDRVSRLWLENALVNKVSFFNSDMHWGNFLVEVKPETIEVSILDFGMSDSIPWELRKSFIGLAAGSLLNNSHLITQMLWSLQKEAPRNNLTKSEVLKRVEEQIAQQSLIADKAKTEGKQMKRSELSPLDWVKFGATWGIDYRSEFVGFNRGLTAIMMGMGKTRGEIPRSSALAKLLLEEHRTANFLKGMRLVPYGPIASNIAKSIFKPKAPIKPMACSQLFQ
jgi:predicted unusual protein kinase regulating ubiquinone biosynthesis (AarF/ABC1/UbiB family)